MVKIKGKIFKVGNTYAICVKKALIDCEVLHLGKEYEFEQVEGSSTNSIKMLLKNSHFSTRNLGKFVVPNFQEMIA